MTVEHKMRAVSTSVIFQLLKTYRLRIKSLILCGNQNEKHYESNTHNLMPVMPDYFAGAN